jgi:RHS repeat-associated protein
MENITYDKHGNMKTMQLYGRIQNASYGAVVDNLTMTYTGNQLVRVDDAAVAVSLAESMDFKNYSNVATEYTYNANGAMNKDLNKGITGIQYNSLNLPRMMDIKSPVAEARNEYTYSAGGQKLKVVQKWNPDYSTAPVIGSAINTAALTMTKTTDYIGNIIYENNALKRILVDGGYIEGGVYHYYLTDHLGNNRVVAKSDGTLVQKNHYYPFGSIFAGTTGAEKQPYKYNGKELDQMHGLNLYDYSARLYDPIVPHFGTVDPLAEKYYSWSPYAYCANNPVKYIDPTGMSYTYNWEKNRYEDSKGNEVEWGTVHNYIKGEGTDDVVINGVNNSSLTVKTDAINKTFNSSVDFGGNHTVDASNVAIGYETYFEAKGGVGAGIYAQIPIQKVLFLGNSYAGYWYTYAGGEPGVFLQTAADFSMGVGKNWFIAFNNNVNTNKPSGFSGYYTSVGLTAGIKAVAGISINGNWVQSLDETWNTLSLGISGSVGASVGLIGTGNIGGSGGIGYTFLLNKNVVPTKNRSYGDIISNWVTTLFSK